jgi:hypothetical protein
MIDPSQRLRVSTGRDRLWDRQRVNEHAALDSGRVSLDWIYLMQPLLRAVLGSVPSKVEALPRRSGDAMWDEMSKSKNCRSDRRFAGQCLPFPFFRLFSSIVERGKAESVWLDRQ